LLVAQQEDRASAFNPSRPERLLRGDAQATADMAKEFKVFYGKVPTSSSYTMDHTAITYAFDPQGKVRLAIRHEQPAADIAADLRALLRG
jgi:protein SCO1